MKSKLNRATFWLEVIYRALLGQREPRALSPATRSLLPPIIGPASYALPAATRGASSPLAHGTLTCHSTSIGQESHSCRSEAPVQSCLDRCPLAEGRAAAEASPCWLQGTTQPPRAQVHNIWDRRDCPLCHAAATDAAFAALGFRPTRAERMRAAAAASNASSAEAGGGSAAEGSRSRSGAKPAAATPGDRRSAAPVGRRSGESREVAGAADGGGYSADDVTPEIHPCAGYYATAQGKALGRAGSAAAMAAMAAPGAAAAGEASGAGQVEAAGEGEEDDAEADAEGGGALCARNWCTGASGRSMEDVVRVRECPARVCVSCSGTLGQSAQSLFQSGQGCAGN